MPTRREGLRGARRARVRIAPRVRAAFPRRRAKSPQQLQVESASGSVARSGSCHLRKSTCAPPKATRPSATRQGSRCGPPGRGWSVRRRSMAAVRCASRRRPRGCATTLATQHEDTAAQSRYRRPGALQKAPEPRQGTRLLLLRPARRASEHCVPIRCRNRRAPPALAAPRRSAKMIAAVAHPALSTDCRPEHQRPVVVDRAVENRVPAIDVHRPRCLPNAASQRDSHWARPASTNGFARYPSTPVWQAARQARRSTRAAKSAGHVRPDASGVAAAHGPKASALRRSRWGDVPNVAPGAAIAESASRQAPPNPSATGARDSCGSPL